MTSQEPASSLNHRRGTTKSILKAAMIYTLSSKKYVAAFLVLLLGFFFVLNGSNIILHTASKDDGEQLTKKMTEVEHIYPFVKDHCDLTGVEWYPTGLQAWQQRTPYFLLIGAMKGGTTTLWSWLLQHKNIRKAKYKELRYFIPYRYQHFDVTGKVNVNRTRHDMYNSRGGLYNASEARTNEHHFAFEATPIYLVHTKTAIPAILCTCPWVKLLVTLREPTDRVMSHYNFVMDPARGRSTTNTLEDWIEYDFIKLRKANVIQTEVPQELFYGSDAEKMAWNKYLSSLYQDEPGPIGRSLYVIQIELWYQALISIGRDPKTEFMIVRNDDMRTNPDETVNKIFSWLDLPPRHSRLFSERMKTTYTLSEMSNETSTMLREFFKPYNQRLYKLLGEDWTNEWDNAAPHQVPADQIYNESGR